MIHDAMAAHRVIKVVRGLYLNRMVTPPAELCGAAIWLRPSSIVSLQNLLGDSGVWNNYTAMLTAVVPFSPTVPCPSLGLSKRKLVSFTFAACQRIFLAQVKTVIGSPKSQLFAR